MATITANKTVSIIPWNAGGSKDVLKKVLENRVSPRMVLMEKVRHAFNATWKPKEEGYSPYLGSGGFGDVYRVEVNGSVQALKVSKNGYLKTEFDALKAAAATHDASVVKVLVEMHGDEFSAYTRHFFSLHFLICTYTDGIMEIQDGKMPCCLEARYYGSTSYLQRNVLV